ncbi:unnamed protein product [Camellia sinensis]
MVTGRIYLSRRGGTVVERSHASYVSTAVTGQLPLHHHHHHDGNRHTIAAAAPLLSLSHQHCHHRHQSGGVGCWN